MSFSERGQIPDHQIKGLINYSNRTIKVEESCNNDSRNTIRCLLISIKTLANSLKDH